ncbi:MAG: reverse transcriptase domain-containing protein [Gammaproteobacteria bacterium]
MQHRATKSSAKRTYRSKPWRYRLDIRGLISPLLSNLYLHLLARIWDRHELERRYRPRLVRYADDVVALCARDVEAPMAALRQVLAKLGLSLNETKTRVGQVLARSLSTFSRIQLPPEAEPQERQTLPPC